MLSDIGHVQRQTASNWVAYPASLLGWSQEDLEAAAQEVQAAYDEDRGWKLVRAVFEGEASSSDASGASE